MSPSNSDPTEIHSTFEIRETFSSLGKNVTTDYVRMYIIIFLK